MLGGLKRGREWEENEDGTEKQDQGQSKKLRTLPFRSSPSSQYPALSFSTRPRNIRPHILTPVESSEDESDHDISLPEKLKNPSLNLDLVDDDMDMDMDMEASQDQPIWSPKQPDTSYTSTFPPARLTIDTPRFANTQTPRIPTPIYGHFSAPRYPGEMPPPSPAMLPPFANILAYPRARDSDPFLRRRALPSPISEDENMDSPTVMTKAMLGNLRMSASPERTSFSSQETLTPDTPSTGNWPDSSPRNRRRSDAISGGDTNKVVFSMGFRADCHKCQERAPGHYSHVTRA